MRHGLSIFRGKYAVKSGAQKELKPICETLAEKGFECKIRKSLMNKIYANAEEAIKDIQNNSTIMLGGFGLCGIFLKTASLH